MNASRGEVTRAGEILSLTAKEYQLLLYLVQNANRILSKQKICEAVWGETYLGLDNTITVDIHHLREKIQPDPSNPTYIQTVIGLGYRFSRRGVRMRWKITGQILGLLLIILPVMYISLFILSLLFFSRLRNLSGGGSDLSTKASNMTIQFEPALQWDGNQMRVDPAKMAELHNLGIWLQVLDENGNEIFEQYKPASAPTHYTPAELILNYKYSGAIKDPTQGYTLFVAKADREP